MENLEFFKRKKMFQLTANLNKALNLFTCKASYLMPWMSFNLRELELSVVRVHAFDLFPCWCSQNFYNLNKLINATLAREQWLP